MLWIQYGGRIPLKLVKGPNTSGANFQFAPFLFGVPSMFDSLEVEVLYPT